MRADIQVSLPCVMLSLRNVDFWVVEQDMNDVLLGRSLIICLGFDLVEFFKKLCKSKNEVDEGTSVATEIIEADPVLATIGFGGLRYMYLTMKRKRTQETQ